MSQYKFRVAAPKQNVKPAYSGGQTKRIRHHRNAIATYLEDKALRNQIAEVYS